MAKRSIKRLSRKVRESCEHRSDVRTAEFVAAQLRAIQEDLSDLCADMRTFDHYSEIEDIGYAVWKLHRVRKKYEKFVEIGYWEDD